MSHVVLDPVFPIQLLVIGGILLLCLSVWMGARLSLGIPPWQRAVLGSIRSLAVCTLILILMQPSRLVSIAPTPTEDVAWIGIDTSRSMLQKDVDGKTRIQAAIDLLRENRLLPAQADADLPALRFFSFDEASKWIQKPDELAADGETTRIHDTLMQVISSSRTGGRAKAIFLLTDGHDFQLVSPARTAAAARLRRIPIYAVPLGSTGQVRDAAVRISSYPALCYIKQKARLQAAVRLIGCKFETLQCQLLRGGRLVETKRIDTEQAQQVFVDFDVQEDKVGQYEYEIRVLPLDNESDARNNSAITYLNVVDQQISILVLEADPFWDTTFLQRSLRANDKFRTVSFVKYSDKRVHCVADDETGKQAALPETAADFAKYDIVAVGRKLDRLLGPSQLSALEEYVREGKGCVVFCSGPALSEGAQPLGIEPAVWGGKLGAGGYVQVTREGRAAAPFTMLANMEPPPEVIDGYTVSELKTLAVSLGGLHDGVESEPIPGFVHRRVGNGQVMSIGLIGLWRWELNAEADGSMSMFDRFWDQLLLWLLSSRDMASGQTFTMRINSANILLGNKVYFRLLCRDPDAPKGRASVSIESDGKEAGSLSLDYQKSGESQLAEWLPPGAGKYSAHVAFPDGTRSTLQFIVYAENEEETEVAVDALLLKRLCSGSGGRLLSAAELNTEIRSQDQDNAGMEVRQEKRTLWDRKFYFYVIGLLFGAEWFLRRRWGLN